MEEGTTLEEAKEIISLMETELNLTQIFQIQIIFREKYQIEIITMHQN